jgi:transposase-like protein/IS1 family transposase
MVCPKCESERVKRFGKNRNGSQRYRCLDCKKTFTEEQLKPLGSMRVDFDKAVYCLKMLLEGVSIRSCERLTGMNRNTLCDLVLSVGQRCKDFLADRIQNVPVAEIEVDEVWSFVSMKEKTKIIQKREDYEVGDAYLYVGIERNSKLIVSFLIGKRHQDYTFDFAANLRRATTGRFQLSTDGWLAYRASMPTELGHRIDFAQIVKVFETPGRHKWVGKYSPAEIVRIDKKPVCGSPVDSRISTSHVERSNLTLRMTVRRWTRLTNAFSKSWKHHEAAVALYIAFYNYCRHHSTIKTTPAVAAKLTDHRWTMEELLTAMAA